MKKLILFLMVFAICSNTKAQVAETDSFTTAPRNKAFLTNNTIWNQLHYSMYVDSMCFQYGIFGDTLINGLIYNKLYETEYPEFLHNGEPLAFIREDEGMVYYINRSMSGAFPSGEDEKLLYDFTKSVGDSIMIYLYDDLYYKYIVKAIDSLIVGNEYRKVLHVEREYCGKKSWDEEFWIEGVGSSNGLFFPIKVLPLNAPYYSLVCFSQDNEVQYLNPEFNMCYPTVSTDEIYENESIDVIPNPITGTSIINLPETGNYNTIDIYDVTGHRVDRITFENERQIMLNCSEYKSGMYVFQIYGVDNKPIIGRFTVIKN